MEKIVVDGGVPLSGRVDISGMKNAAVAVIFATILTSDVCVIDNLPEISDVADCLAILQSIGANIRVISRNKVEIDTRNIRDAEAPLELVRRIRASYYLAGAMLGRFGKAKVGLPGGCNFGVRPIDLHVKAFERLGATVDLGGGCIDAMAENGLKGEKIYFDSCSVGATVNAILAGVLADGVTIIENPAKEPHVVDLANFLNACGANIFGAGMNVIKITGVKSLHGCEYAIIPDMIEAGTFMVAAAATKGSLYINGIIPKHLETISSKLREMGVTVDEFEFDQAVRVTAGEKLLPANVKTLAYPGFPTDMHPQMAVLLCLADGASHLNETIWNNRFRYAEELQRMGAKIRVEDRTAYFEGNTVFSPSVVKAVDLRAGAAVVLAALATEGRTVIEDISLIERGYDNIVKKLQNVGANIRKVDTPDHASGAFFSGN